MGRLFAEETILVRKTFVIEHFGATQLASSAVSTSLGRCRKVVEKQRNKSVKFAGRDSANLTSDRQKTKHVDEYEIDQR